MALLISPRDAVRAYLSRRAALACIPPGQRVDPTGARIELAKDRPALVSIAAIGGAQAGLPAGHVGLAEWHPGVEAERSVRAIRLRGARTGAITARIGRASRVGDQLAPRRITAPQAVLSRCTAGTDVAGNQHAATAQARLQRRARDAGVAPRTAGIRPPRHTKPPLATATTVGRIAVAREARRRGGQQQTEHGSKSQRATPHPKSPPDPPDTTKPNPRHRGPTGWGQLGVRTEYRPRPLADRHPLRARSLPAGQIPPHPCAASATPRHRPEPAPRETRHYWRRLRWCSSSYSLCSSTPGSAIGPRRSTGALWPGTRHRAPRAFPRRLSGAIPSVPAFGPLCPSRTHSWQFGNWPPPGHPE